MAIWDCGFVHSIDDDLLSFHRPWERRARPATVGFTIFLTTWITNWLVEMGVCYGLTNYSDFYFGVEMKMSSNITTFEAMVTILRTPRRDWDGHELIEAIAGQR